MGGGGKQSVKGIPAFSLPPGALPWGVAGVPLAASDIPVPVGCELEPVVRPAATFLGKRTFQSGSESLLPGTDGQACKDSNPWAGPAALPPDTHPSFRSHVSATPGDAGVKQVGVQVARGGSLS